MYLLVVASSHRLGMDGFVHQENVIGQNSYQIGGMSGLGMTSMFWFVAVSDRFGCANTLPHIDQVDIFTQSFTPDIPGETTSTVIHTILVWLSDLFVFFFHISTSD